jgi:ankyrin repeat protein
MLVYGSLDGEPIDVALIELLLAQGADISSVNTNGDTALHLMAKSLRQVKAAQFLVSKGADVTVVNAKGDTPVHEVMRGLL